MTEEKLQIDRIKNNIQASLNVVAEKGVTVSTDSTSDQLPGLIAQISVGVSLPELESPASEDEIFLDKQTIGADGEIKTGTFTIQPELTQQNSLIDRIKTALQGKAAGGGSAKPEQTKSLTITENGEYEIMPDEGYTLSGVQVNVNVVEVDDFAANYQRVEYITSDGTAYVTTDFIADNTCGIEMVLSFPGFADHTWSGSRTDSGSTRFFAPYAYSASIWYAGFNGNVKISASTQIETIYRCQVNFLNSRLTTVHDEAGALKGSASISETLTEHIYQICIFTQNYGGIPRTPRIFNLYSARCSRGYDVVREYIPCYRKSDGVIGLYDKFTKQFLTNAADTGAFAKGPDVMEEA